MGKGEDFALKLQRKPPPSDIKFRELAAFLKKKGFSELKTGKTSGSRVRFALDSDKAVMIRLHKAHGTNPVDKGAIVDIVETLSDNGLL